ncbi:tetratricopeptide repeat protein [Opisthorchis viverrini]|uniref:Tetratricopeptide repeat protein n=1 Tax=Opisthorchis viverrini TaxID=6198 RepID=A0A1S8X986_OPIVI|nr:tetratricopeptide repeat protein [Opisthorchis viverrini]
MYIAIEDFSWFENDQEVSIEVPLRGLAKKDKEVMITSRFIKMVIKPYMFECILLNPILVDESRVELSGSQARFVLKKAEAQIWGRLLSEEMSMQIPNFIITEDKHKLIQLRNEAIIEHQEREKAKQEAKLQEIRKGEKDSLNKVMKLEADERERIESEKKFAGEKAVEELVKIHQQEQEEKAQLDQKIIEARQLANEITEQRIMTTKSPEERIALSLNEKPIELPVRTSTNITVNFTPRIFPTPERESVKQEEEEWLNKQAEHRRAMLKKVVGDQEMSDKELDPQWLRNKGDTLFRAGDFEAAVEAYSRAIEINPKMHSAFSNRAACHLQLRNFFKALEDSSTALDLCVPAVPQNLRSRVRAHARRAAAFCNLKMFKEGLIEYRAAHQLDPSDSSIEADMRNIEKYLNQLAAA